MKDPSIRLPVSNNNRAPSQRVDQDDIQAVSGQARKRFRRRAGARTGEPTRDLPVAPPLAAVSGRALVPSRKMALVRDEWEALRFVSPGVRRHFLSGAPLVNFFRHDPAARAFDLLRTRLLQTLRANGWNRVAIASPTAGCGSTFTAVNLAQSLARVPGSRTVLMDLNHRNPGIAGMLDMDDVGNMRGFLTGKVPVHRHLMRATKTLALGLTAGPDRNSAEILHDARCGEALNRMTKALRPDVVLYDLPPVLDCDDLSAFLAQIDGVLLVADGTQTMAGQIAASERLFEGRTRLLGVILNRARPSGPQEHGF